MRWVLISLVATACGRQLIEERRVDDAKRPMLALSLSMRAARASMLPGVVAPARLEATLVGTWAATQPQTAFVSETQLGAPTSETLLTPTDGGFSVSSLTITQVQGLGAASVTLRPLDFVLGATVPVSGELLLSAGDVADSVPMTGTLVVTAATGAGAMGLRAAHRRPEVRPFDELELCFTRPMAAADATNLRVLVQEVPFTFRFTSAAEVSSCHRLGLDAFPPPGVGLGLTGFADTLTAPRQEQRRLEPWTGGWAEEPSGMTAAGAGEPGPVTTLLVTTGGTHRWQALTVPSDATSLKLWYQSLSSVRGAQGGSSILLYATHGRPTVVATASATRDCVGASFPFCDEWREASVDVRRSRGQQVWLVVESQARSGLRHLDDGFAIASPQFDR